MSTKQSRFSLELSRRASNYYSPLTSALPHRFFLVTFTRSARGSGVLIDLFQSDIFELFAARLQGLVNSIVSRVTGACTHVVVVGFRVQRPVLHAGNCTGSSDS